MVIRVWRAKATAEGAEQYQELYERSILPKLRSLDGFQKAYLLNRVHDGEVAIEVHTHWDSVDAIHAFSGPDADTAVVPPEVRACVTSFETTAPWFEAVEFLAVPVLADHVLAVNGQA